MHPPFHLYEFQLKSFEELGKKLNFKIEHSQRFVCPIFPPVPKIVHPLLRSYMRWTNTGAQIKLYLKKHP